MFRPYLLCTLSLLLSIVVSLAAGKKSVSNEKAPPNCVQLGSNFYFDKTEMRNIDWIEYLQWQKKVFGINSMEYNNALPDTTVWREKLAYCEPYVDYYFNHPAYHNYPVVGINKKQAEDYCDWRSARVFEMQLIQEGIINVQENSSPENVFTLERYLDGEIEKLKDEEIPIPKFSLPSKEIWEYAARGRLDGNLFPYGINTYEKGVMKALKQGRSLINVKRTGNIGYLHTDSPVDINDDASITAPVDAYLPNQFGIYNMIGNVAEMTDEDRLCKGGGWNHLEKEVSVYADFEYEKASSWLGFRCVATYYSKEEIYKYRTHNE